MRNINNSVLIILLLNFASLLIIFDDILFPFWILHHFYE